jgi:uncharacterized membrane protein YqiK
MFRDNEEAAQARVDVLLREIESLKAENQRLKAQSPGSGGVAVGISIEAILSALLWSSVLFGVVYFLPKSAGPLIVAGLSALMLLQMFYIRTVSIASKPGEALIVSGRKHHTPDGRVVGYRVLRPGERMLFLPMIDKATPFSLRPVLLSGDLSSVYLKGAQKVHLSFSAVCRVSEQHIHNAVERFLDRPAEEIAKVAREVAEGSLRGMSASLSLDDLQRDHQKISDMFMKESREDFEKLGLELEHFTLKSAQA